MRTGPHKGIPGVLVQALPRRNSATEKRAWVENNDPEWAGALGVASALVSLLVRRFAAIRLQKVTLG